MIDSDTRSSLYSGLIVGLCNPSEDLFCIECNQELWACECNAPPYRGSDPSLYRNEERHYGNRSR